MEKLKIEWDKTASEAQIARLETLKAAFEAEGVTVELIGGRPNDRG